MLTGFAMQMTDFERSLNGGEREDDYRKFVEYLLFRYMAGTCYSHDLLENVKIAAVFYLLLRLMDVRRAKEKKAFMFEDRMEIIHLFSREVEYSDENMEMLREELMFDECFKTNSLISALTNFEFRVI
jgi:lysine-N-methylase